MIERNDNIWICVNQADEIVVLDKTGKVIAKLVIKGRGDTSPTLGPFEDFKVTADFFRASNKSGKRFWDIQSNNAKQAAADPTEDGTAIPSQPSEPKLGRDVALR